MFEQSFKDETYVVEICIHQHEAEKSKLRVKKLNYCYPVISVENKLENLDHYNLRASCLITKIK